MLPSPAWLRSLAVLSILVAPLASPLAASLNLPPLDPAVEQAVARVAQQPAVARAVELIKADATRMFDEQVRISEIPAPPFKEQQRADYYAKMLREAGLADAAVDKVGNVVALRRGTGNGPKLMLAAHLDTVFPEGTDVKVHEKDGRYYGPGLTDNAVGLTTLLAVARSLHESDLRTTGDIYFIGTVGEEELGDLRGIKALFRELRDIDGFIALDGVGLGRIVNAATGSNRFNVTFKGPGGHSFAAFGLPSAIHAMGRAVAKIADLVPPASPKTTFTVGTVHGGTSVNAIAAEASIGIDVRSNSPAELHKFVDSVMAAVHEGVAEENRRWNNKSQITVEINRIGERPAGTTPVDSRIVQAARATLAAIGVETRTIEGSSTDANLPISLGIPAVTLGAGGRGAGTHSLREWYAPVNNTQGAHNLLLLALTLTGIDGVSEPLLEKRPPR